MKAALLKTEEAFLLAHDGAGGDATNCLGLQLMLLRDELSGKSDWTRYISTHIDLRNGTPKNKAGMEQWQGVVQRASQQLRDVLTIRKMIPDAKAKPEKTSQPVATSVASCKPVHQEVAERHSALQPAQVTRDVAARKAEERATASTTRAPEQVTSTRVTQPIIVQDECTAEVPASRKRVRFEEEVKPSSFSDLIRIQPEKEVRFAQSTSFTTMTLNNVSQRSVAFKFKASTSSCLARPMTGTMQPGERREVRLSLAPSFGSQAVSERYLIQAMPVESSAVLSRDEWAAMGKGSLCELRMPALRDAA